MLYNGKITSLSDLINMRIDLTRLPRTKEIQDKIDKINEAIKKLSTEIEITIDAKGGTKLNYKTVQAKLLTYKIREFEKDSHWLHTCQHNFNMPKQFGLLRFKDIELFRHTFNN